MVGACPFVKRKVYSHARQPLDLRRRTWMQRNNIRDVNNLLMGVFSTLPNVKGIRTFLWMYLVPAHTSSCSQKRLPVSWYCNGLILSFYVSDTPPWPLFCNSWETSHSSKCLYLGEKWYVPLKFIQSLPERGTSKHLSFVNLFPIWIWPPQSYNWRSKNNGREGAMSRIQAASVV